MCGQLLCAQVGDHLRIVKHHARHVIAEALRTHAADGICLFGRPVSSGEDVVEVLHVTKGSLRPGRALFGIVEAEKLRVFPFHVSETVARQKVRSGHELSRRGVFADVLCRLVLRRKFAIGSENFVHVREIQRRVRHDVNASPARQLRTVPAIVEVVDLHVRSGRHKALHEAVVQINKRVGNACLPVSLRVHKAQLARSLKAMLMDDVIDPDNGFFSKIHIVRYAAANELV